MDRMSTWQWWFFHGYMVVAFYLYFKSDLPGFRWGFFHGYVVFGLYLFFTSILPAIKRNIKRLREDARDVEPKE